MIKILFICHGNICRSPMAEFMLKDMIRYRGIDQYIQVASAATSREEIGNDIHPGTKAKLDEANVPYAKRKARQITRADYENYDYIIAMDEENIRGLRRIIGGDPQGKISRLLSFAGQERDIADPWYTGNFDATYDDILVGLSGLLRKLQAEIKDMQ